VERLADEQAGEKRIHEDRPVPIVPVEGHEAGLARPERGRLRRERRVKLLVTLADALDHHFRMSPTADCPASMP